MKTKEDEIIKQFEQLIKEETDKKTKELLKMTLASYVAADSFNTK
ncbi:hypothetical protein [Paenibacillus chitinolyticus]|nr:hypothetical protein [Paenibacillus chitinolyticus]